jgi:DNA polymerase I
MAGIRMYAERQAVNHKIQGTAADINKSAMVRAHRRIQREGYGGQMHIILTVHDEIIMEVPERLAEEGIELLKEAMEGVKIELRCPLVADVHAADNWAGAK